MEDPKSRHRSNHIVRIIRTKIKNTTSSLFSPTSITHKADTKIPERQRSTCDTVLPHRDVSVGTEAIPSWAPMSLACNKDKWLKLSKAHGSERASFSVNDGGVAQPSSDTSTAAPKTVQQQSGARRGSISGFLQSVGIRLSSRCSLDATAYSNERCSFDVPARHMRWKPSAFSVRSSGYTNQCPTCLEMGLVKEDDTACSDHETLSCTGTRRFASDLERTWPPYTKSHVTERGYKPRELTRVNSFSSRVIFQELLCNSNLGQVWMSRFDGHEGLATKVSLAKKFEAEFALLKELRISPRIVQVVDHDPHTICGAALVMRCYDHQALQLELASLRREVRAASAAASAGNLSEKDERNLQKTTVKQETKMLKRASTRFLELALQVALAVQDVHHADTLHCNIQMSSLLWDASREHIVLGSFSQARSIAEPARFTTMRDCTMHATIPTPPEMDSTNIQPQTYSTSSDIWHLAVCALEMWMGDHGDRVKPHLVPSGMPLCELWAACLDENPERSPSMNKVVCALRM